MSCTGYRVDKNWFLIDQSWGNNPTGPTGDIEIPPYSFWVTEQTLRSMLAMSDSWAFSGFDGWEADLMRWLI